MPVGGINNQQPFAGTPSTSVVAPQGDGAAPASAAPSAQAPTGFGPVAGTDAGPVAGTDAGSVAPSGGSTSDGMARAAAIAGGYGVAAANNAADVAATNQVAAAQQPVTAIQPATAGTTTPAGPAAWNEDWAKRFRDAGAPPDILQQLTFTGAMGADAAQLEQMLAKVTSEVDTVLAQFAHEHEEAFLKLRGKTELGKLIGAPGVSDRFALAQIAAASNAGQVDETQLDMWAESAGRSAGEEIWKTMVLPTIVWSLIPAWGALRVAFMPFTGNKDILTGEKMWGDGMSNTITVLGAIGGGLTAVNHIRGFRGVAAGHALARTDAAAKAIVGRELLTNRLTGAVSDMTTGQRLLSYVPGTRANKVMGSLSMLTDLRAGVKQLSGLEQRLAQNVLDKWETGALSIHRDPASKFGKMGYQPNTRGILLNRQKAMVATVQTGAKPTILLDGRMTGKTLAAHIAAQGTEFADDLGKVKLKTEMLQAGGLTKAAGAQGRITPAMAASLRETAFGNATKQLLAKEYITAPTGLAKLGGAVRPGPLQDAMWAAKNVDAGTIGAKHGTAAISKWVKFGVPGALALGAGYWFTQIKPEQDAKAAAAEAAKAEAEATAAKAPTPEQEAALARFGQLPAAQQAQLIQEQYAALEAIAQQPGITAEQQAQVEAGAAELQLYMAVADGGAATGGGAAAQQPATTGGFTAKGLGLA